MYEEAPGFRLGPCNWKSGSKALPGEYGEGSEGAGGDGARTNVVLTPVTVTPVLETAVRPAATSVTVHEGHCIDERD